jgi:tetratricopeptide (TPR) repeat protein
MQARSASVIAISGLGGIGKSALATMAIFRQSWRFKAVVMISARNRPMLGPDEIVPLLDGALSLKGSIYTLPNQAERLLEAIEALNKNRVLVVLDNFDDLTESAAREWVSFLSDLDPRQGSICLITLRPAVRPPLTDLAGLGHLPLERLGEPDALRLIADRITAGDLWKKVIASEPESIKERQRILDLAEAAYLPALPPNILISLENLSDKAGQHPFALRLAVGDLAYPHVDWVKALSNVSDLRGKDWESKGQAMIGKMVADLLLAAPETANLLQAIMVFHNGATYEALKSVADPEVDSTTFDDKLKWVINSSLLESLGTNRYSLHPLTLNYLIKSYPSSSPSQAEFRKKHAGYFIDWADEHRSDFGLLEAELPNLRASFDFVTENATRNDELVWRLAFACFDMLQTHGYLKEALTFMTEAAKACEKLEYKDKLGYVYNFLGTILINLSRIDESSEFLQKAELIFQETKNQNGLASTWSNIGIIHFRRSEYNLALGYYNRAALVLEETGDRQMLVTVYNNIGLTHYSRGEYDLALEYYNRAAPVLEEIGDRKTLATVYNNIGLIHYSRSEYDLALDYFNRAAPVLEEIGDRKELVSVYNNIGLIRYSRSEYDLALEYYNKAAPVLEEIGDRQSLATVYNNIGTIHYARSEYDQALEYLNKAAPVLEEIGNRQSLATIYNNIGTIHYARSEYDQALEYLNKAAPVLEEIGDRKTLATVYNNIGMIHYSRSKNDLALEYFNRAAPVLEEIGDRQMLATVYNNIGLIHYSRSEYDLALEYFNRAATVLEEIGDQQVLATVYNNIGGIYLARSEYEQALEYFNRAAPVLEEIGDRQMLAKVYNNIGMIHDNRSEYDLGLEYYNRAAPMLEEIGDRKNLATVYKNIGFIHSSRSEYDLALEYYNRAVFILKAIGDQIELVLTERIIEQIKQTKDDQSKREASLEENKLELKKDKDSP